MLDQHDLAITDVGKVSGKSIVDRLLLTDLESHIRRITVPIRTVIDRKDVTLMTNTAFRFDRIAKVLRKRCNPALSGRVTSHASNATFFGRFVTLHRGT
jgi:hypothetical protein